MYWQVTLEQCKVWLAKPILCLCTFANNPQASPARVIPKYSANYPFSLPTYGYDIPTYDYSLPTHGYPLPTHGYLLRHMVTFSLLQDVVIFSNVWLPSPTYGSSPTYDSSLPTHDYHLQTSPSTQAITIVLRAAMNKIEDYLWLP